MILEKKRQWMISEELMLDDDSMDDDELEDNFVFFIKDFTEALAMVAEEFCPWARLAFVERAVQTYLLHLFREGWP